MFEVTATRRKAWVVHVLREDELSKLVIEARMEDKRPTGRPRIGMIDDIMKGSYEQMKRKALDRECWVREFGCRVPAMQQRTDMMMRVKEQN